MSNSLFQQRHFKRLAWIASRMNLSDAQKDILVDYLADTNPNFKYSRFRYAMEQC